MRRISLAVSTEIRKHKKVLSFCKLLVEIIIDQVNIGMCLKRQHQACTHFLYKCNSGEFVRHTAPGQQK